MTSSDSMIERVARALCRVHFAKLGAVASDPMDEETYWRGWMADARAAIEAMVEPDSEVVLHGAKAIADEFDCELEELGGSEFMDFVAAAKSSFKAMLRSSLTGDTK